MMPDNFEQLLDNYAELVVKVGLNLRMGQRLAIEAPVETAACVRRVAVKAYQAGARLVDIIWNDDQLTLARFQYAPRDSFEEFPAWQAKALEEYGRNGDALLTIYAADPDLLKDQDPVLVSLTQTTALKHLEPVHDYLMRNKYNWCVASIPIPGWAARVFPGLSPEDQEYKLWDAIFEVCRVKQGDPIGNWKMHLKQLALTSSYLTSKQYSALKYTAPGTDLTIGLPKGHTWISGQMKAENGITFVANLPTEEIFTLPHRDRVEGVVTATKPLSYANTLIKDFSLTFENGRVVSSRASQGEATLHNLIETDEGSHYLGEVSLLPHSSPISQSGLMFYNSLFDENAACHIALGRAYQFTLQGGITMTGDEFAAAGGNHSLTHVDFMIGSNELNVDGICEDGSRQAVMRAGEWAFKIED
jgi:aminopeptidase